MGRLRAYFDQLAHPMQDVHSGTITRAYCRAIYEESVSRCFILPPLAGEVRRSRIGGGERSEPIHNPQRRRRCRPLSEAMHSEHDLKEH